MSIDQRDYRSQQQTYRSIGSARGMSQTHRFPFDRKNSQDLMMRQMQQLQRNFSRQQQSLQGGKHKKMKHFSSKGSIKHSQNNTDKNIDKNIKQIQEIVGQSYLLGPAKNIQPVLSIKKFQFKIISYIAQVALAYGITIGLMYLIKISNFPFFQILLVFGLMDSVSPWSFTNIIMLVACGMIIGNYFLNVQVLTYPSILICYFSVLIFNQHNKGKLIFIPILVTVLVWGFVVIPSLFVQFYTYKNLQAFFYIFPLFVFIIRMFLYISYRWIKYTQYIFLQLPLFIMGMQYGVMMTLNVGSIQFWYLMVFFTLQIINDRTQFMLRLLVSVWRSCDRVRFVKRKGQGQGEKNVREYQLENIGGGSKQSQRGQNRSKNIKIQNKQQKQKQILKQPSKIVQQDIPILPAHASGYNSINSLHIVCIVYVFTKLPIYSSPYTNSTTLYNYIQLQWYIPLVIWALSVVYEGMCLVLERKRKDKLLVGFVNNGIWHTILRAWMLAIGLWMFYMGLGIGNYAVIQNIKTK